MIQTPDVPDVMCSPPSPGRRTPLVIGLALLAITTALVLLFTLVVIPAAGAAGGCGGG
jgi:hypothetical protein